MKYVNYRLKLIGRLIKFKENWGLFWMFCNFGFFINSWSVLEIFSDDKVKELNNRGKELEDKTE
ncbi:hypothetical protein H0178_19470 [Cytobacillus firmus]|nr:hypothetical protein [Cytobacillus firmus]